MNTVIKKLLDANLLSPGYKKDLVFLKSICRIFTSGNHVTRTTFDNALYGLNDTNKVHTVSNWYVILMCVPDITSPKTRAAMLTRLEEWPCVRRYLCKSTVIPKIQEFLNSTNLENSPNIKW